MKAEDNRSRNLLVFGITEEDEESVQIKVPELLEQLDEKPKIMNSNLRLQREARQTLSFVFISY